MGTLNQASPSEDVLAALGAAAKTVQEAAPDSAALYLPDKISLAAVSSVFPRHPVQLKQLFQLYHPALASLAPAEVSVVVDSGASRVLLAAGNPPGKQGAPHPDVRAREGLQARKLKSWCIVPVACVWRRGLIRVPPPRMAAA